MTKHFLSEGGRFYLVAIEQNKPQAIVRKLTEKGMHVQVSSHQHGSNIVSFSLIDRSCYDAEQDVKCFI